MQNVQGAWYSLATDFHIIYNLTAPPPSYIRHPGDVFARAVGWVLETVTSSLIFYYSPSLYIHLYICLLFTLEATRLQTLTYLNVFLYDFWQI